MHTIKGSAAQAGLHRISRVAHRAEDLIGRLREGQLQPSVRRSSTSAWKLSIHQEVRPYSQWPDDAAMQSSVKSLLTRIAKLAPEEQDDSATPTETYTTPQAVAESVAAVESTEVVEQVPSGDSPNLAPPVVAEVAAAHPEPNYWKAKSIPRSRGNHLRRRRNRSRYAFHWNVSIA